MGNLEWFSIKDKEPPLNTLIIVENIYGGYIYCKRTKKSYKAIDGTPRREFDFEFWALFPEVKYDDALSEIAKELEKL